MEEDEMSNNCKEITLERLESSKDESLNDGISKGDIKNNDNVINDDMNKVFITLTMILLNEKTCNDKEKAIEQLVIKVIKLVTN